MKKSMHIEAVLSGKVARGFLFSKFNCNLKIVFILKPVKNLDNPSQFIGGL